MSDPQRALTLRAVEIGGKHVTADQIIWVHARQGDQAEVEYRDHRGKVPLDAIVPYPVKRPELEDLRKLDPCFGLPDKAFETEHLSTEHYFELLRCRAHGRRFLRDMRGSLGMYSTMTLLQEDEDGTPDEIWARYHRRSHSWLFLEGRTL